MAEEIALFIDFENIRYSLLNTQHREPDPQELINVARRYGTVMVAKAYADWSRQPEMFKGSLTAAMIDRVDCPAKQRDRYRNGWQAPTNGGAPTWNTARETPNDSSTWNGGAGTTLNASDDEQDESATREMSNIRIATPESTPDVVSIAPSSPNSSGTQYGSQSTVDLNMLMDIIETVFDRPTISTFVLMTGDRDFTRICARLKLRLNKFVVVAGVPGTVSRDLTAAANQFVLLGNHMGYNVHTPNSQPTPNSMGMEADDPQLLQFLDYIDRHWAWRTIIGVSNFIGDPYNHKNRFRGRLTRDSARDLLQACIQQGILILQTDANGNEDLRLNRANPVVETALASAAAQQQQYANQNMGQANYTQPAPTPWASQYNQPSSSFMRRTPSIITTSAPLDDELVEGDEDEEEGDIEE